MAHLGVVIPGGPFFLSAVLRIPAVALQERRVELRDVALQPGFNPSGTLEDNRAYFEGVGRQVQAFLDEQAWDEVTFVAKSVGTMILGFVGPTLSLPPKVSALWLTPTFTLDFVRDGAIATGWRSLVVSGSADPWYDAERTQEVLDAIDARHLLIDGAEHNLEVAGDVRTTLRALDDLATATLSFMASS